MDYDLSEIRPHKRVLFALGEDRDPYPNNYKKPNLVNVWLTSFGNTANLSSPRSASTLEATAKRCRDADLKRSAIVLGINGTFQLGLI